MSLHQPLPQNPEFLSLDDLLTESIAQQSQEAKEKDLRQKLKQNRIADPKERADTQALLRQWDTQREWVRSANVMVINRQQCKACGTFHTTITGYFEMYMSKRNNGATRKTNVKIFERPDLPKLVEYHDSLIEICHNCADDAGWPLQDN